MKKQYLIHAIFILVAIFAATSCGPDLNASWQLTDFRILGVRATVTADPTRVNPSRGEATTLELVTADKQMRAVKVVWLILSGASASGGLGALGGLGGGMGGGMGADGGTDGGTPAIALCDIPQLALDLPGLQLRCGPRTQFVPPMSGMGNSDGRGRDSLSIIGMACANGSIYLDTSGGLVPFKCTGEGSRGWAFTYTIFLRGMDGDNHQPRIRGVRAGLVGGPQTEVTMATPFVARPCADQTRNTMCPKVRFTVDFEPDSRESYTDINPTTRAAEMRTERLITGFITTGGKFDGAFRTDSEAIPMAPMENDWLPPAMPGTHRVLLYATDGRGGFVNTEVAVRAE